MPRALRLAPEWECWPLWDDAGNNLAPESLTISRELAARILAWDDVFQARFNADEPQMGGFADPAEEAHWRREGQAIVLSLEALGYVVVTRF